MTRKRITAWCVIGVMLCLGSFYLCSSSAWAKPLTYTVQKGDTLWGICEKIYGNSNLWPELWEMNPFITNPHLLKPGDVITLLENVPTVKKPAAKVPKLSPAAPVSTASKLNEYDLSALTNLDELGYLSMTQVIPQGRIVSGNTSKIMLGKGDILYVEIAEDIHPETGDQFTACHISSMVKDPVTGADSGYVVSYLGQVRIVRHIRENLYKAVIATSFRTIRKGDPLLTYKPVPPCIKLSHPSHELSTHIAAVGEQKLLIGQNSIVYLAEGSMQGVQRGQIFEIVKKRTVNAPEGDSFSEEKITLPDFILGYGLVLDTTEDTATGIVLVAKEAISNGAAVKSLDWTNPPKCLSEVPPCESQ